MKKITSLILVCVLLVSTAMPVHAATAEPAVQPRYTYIVLTAANLEINSFGLAYCSGRITANEDLPVKVVVRLQQLNNSSWSTLKEWTFEGIGSVSGGKYYAVYSGYYYRVYVIYYVYDNDGNILEFTYSHKQVHYE